MKSKIQESVNGNSRSHREINSNGECNQTQWFVALLGLNVLLFSSLLFLSLSQISSNNHVMIVSPTNSVDSHSYTPTRLLPKNYQWFNKSFNLDHYMKTDLQPFLQTLEEKKKKDEDILFPSKYSETCSVILSETKTSYNGAQGKQDWIIYNNFFQGKLDGIYLDLGANEPFLGSNTAFFDICLGWSGICVEPTIKGLEANWLKSGRSCSVFNGCVYKQNTNLNLKGEDANFITDLNTEELTEHVDFCRAKTIETLLHEFKARSRRKTEVDLSQDNKIEIDLISLDIKGLESELLRCWPWDEILVKVWVIETNQPGTVDWVDQVMQFRGYVPYVMISFQTNPLDSVYVRRDREVDVPWPAEAKNGHSHVPHQDKFKCDV